MSTKVNTEKKYLKLLLVIMILVSKANNHVSDAIFTLWRSFIYTENFLHEVARSWISEVQNPTKLINFNGWRSKQRQGA
jgi:hypothetical protein